MIHSVAIWSTHDLFWWNPACYSLPWVHFTFHSFQDYSVEDFLLALTEVWFHCSLNSCWGLLSWEVLWGIPLSSLMALLPFPKISVKRGDNSSTDVSMSVLSASAGMSSGPVALLFFRCFMALLISSLVGLSQLMGIFTIAGFMYGGPVWQIYSAVLQNIQPICSVVAHFLWCSFLACL